MKNYYKEYTNRELELIAKLKNQGMTNKQVAEEMQRSYEGIKAIVSRIGLIDRPKPLTDFDRAIIMSGDSPINIAKIVNRTNTQVSLIRYRLKKKGYGKKSQSNNG